MGPHYSTLMPRFDDGPPEPAWVGPRAVCVSQGSTGTHGFFDAVVKLGLPAAHWFDQHRAGSGETFSVRYEERDAVWRKVGASIFPGHDAMLAQYDLAKACATPASGLDCPEPGAWADATEAAVRDAVAGGFSASDVPYAAVPLLLASSLSGNGTVFVRLERDANDWARHRITDHSADGDPICNRSLWGDSGSPLDLHTCARRCAAAGLPGSACFISIEALSPEELARAYARNEALLSATFADAVVFDMLDGADGAQWSPLRSGHHCAVVNPRLTLRRATNSRRRCASTLRRIHPAPARAATPTCKRRAAAAARGRTGTRAPARGGAAPRAPPSATGRATARPSAAAARCGA